MSNDNLTPTDDMSNPLRNVRSWAQELRDTIANFKPMDEADARLIAVRLDDYDRFLARIDQELADPAMDHVLKRFTDKAFDLIGLDPIADIVAKTERMEAGR